MSPTSYQTAPPRLCIITTVISTVKPPASSISGGTVSHHCGGIAFADHHFATEVLNNSNFRAARFSDQ